MKLIAFFCLLLCHHFRCSIALLFPQQNEFRSLDSLDGLWTFVREPTDSNGIGLANGWASMDLATFQNATRLPVPSAFNDLSAERELREHVGWVWYQREYRVPEAILAQTGRRSLLRFGSVQYSAIVFVNGKEVGAHAGGHLPFQFEVPQLLPLNTITVAVNNTLSDETIPPGNTHIIKLSSGEKIVQQIPNFDFFNYAGILRPVHFWHLPQAHINRIKIIANSSGEFSYRIGVDYGKWSEGDVECKLTIFFNKSKVAELAGLQNTISIENAQLWWPRGMGKSNLYEAKVELSLKNGQNVDVYRETFGFRSVYIDGTQIHINGRPFYCHGFGMHEDFEVHGRGFDRSVMVKDLNMFEWLNGNCYRTSHYPYSEERAYEADRRGIAVITEVPAVGLRRFKREQQQLHGKMITEMVMRDWNHPSVIMWSLANEPEVHNGTSGFEYFNDLVLLTKQLDGTRPVTVVFGGMSERKVATALDVICLNRYYGWYTNLGLLGAIKDGLTKEIASWQSEFNRPVMLSEYGAEAIAGLHDEPSVAFTEQYQAELIQLTGEALDKLRAQGKIAGEMLWNFADFMTSQSLTRVNGNHKGVLTRERRPKMGAYVIQKRYKKLMEEAKRGAKKTEL